MPIFPRISEFAYKADTTIHSILRQKCNPIPLALFRIAFGFLMLFDIPLERGLEDADIRFSDPNFCFFPLFPWIKRVPVQIACVLYSIMGLGALGICIGFKFKQACPVFLCPYLYFLLLDKSRWNNHSYLFALFTILLWVSEAGNCLSIDSWHNKYSKPIPRWNYLLIKFQIFILYFFAGIKKLDADWVAGYSMKNLTRHWFFRPMTALVDPHLIEFYLVHMGGLCYDLFVGFMLNFKTSKPFGIFISIIFHGMNSQIFDIGMFPYVCMASLVLFLEPCQFPCSLFSKKNPENTKQKGTTINKQSNQPLSLKEKKTLGLISIYIGIQIFMPFSHFITKGYNTWTPGIYGYSWDMMINSWETLHQKITVKSKLAGIEKYLNADTWVTNDRWSSHADMAVQYASCIARNLKRVNITQIEIYFDIWKSLNGRFQQRIYDPRVDILRAPWSPFTSVPWVLPLLTQYSHFRASYFPTISSTIPTNSSHDVIFVADFHRLHLENFLPKELVNVSLVLIQGEVIFEQDYRNVTLSQDQGLMKVPVESGKFHKVYSTHPLPSCYMYTYSNGTGVPSMGEEDEHEVGIVYQLLTNVKDFITQKVEIYSRCVWLIINSYLKICFDVPMVLRARVG